jgi:hypothetical protein
MIHLLDFLQNCDFFRKPYLYQNLGYFTRIGDFTWRVSDCEELVGVSGDDGAEMLISAFRSRRSISGPEMEV